MLSRLRSLRLQGRRSRRKRERGADSREVEGQTSGLRNVPPATTGVSPATRAEHIGTTRYQEEGIRPRDAPRATPAVPSAPSAALPPRPAPGIHEARIEGIPTAPAPVKFLKFVYPALPDKSRQGMPIIIPPPTSPAPFDEILGLLRESRRAQATLIDQQRESLRHMRRLDEWMSRSVRERDDDLQRLAANIEALSNELRDELGRLGLLRVDQQTYIQRDQAGRRSRSHRA